MRHLGLPMNLAMGPSDMELTIWGCHIVAHFIGQPSMSNYLFSTQRSALGEPLCYPLTIRRVGMPNWELWFYDSISLCIRESFFVNIQSINSMGFAKCLRYLDHFPSLGRDSRALARFGFCDRPSICGRTRWSLVRTMPPREERVKNRKELRELNEKKKRNIH